MLARGKNGEIQERMEEKHTPKRTKGNLRYPKQKQQTHTPKDSSKNHSITEDLSIYNTKFSL